MTRSAGKGNWSSKSVAARWQHQCFYLAIRLGGRGVAYLMLFFVVLWYTALPSMRARSAPYLSRRFPGLSLPGRLLAAFRLNLAFGRTLVDRAVAGITGEFSVEASEEDKRTVLALLDEGKGMVFVSAHVGAWQGALSGLDFTEAPKTIVMHRADADVDKHYFEHGGDGPPFGIIDPAGPLGGSLLMLDALRGGGLLCCMGDRQFGSDRNTLSVPFLGAPMRVPFSFYRIAAAQGAPVAVVFIRNCGPGRAAIEVADIFRVPADLGRKPEAYAPYAARFVQALERFVQDNPYQFFNFFNIWQETETLND